MTYQEVIDAINNADPSAPQYGARLAWPTVKYIGLNNGVMSVWGVSAGPVPYTPTNDDLQATDWIRGGDKPPRR